MSKFNTAAAAAAVRGLVRSARTPTTRTHEGGDGYRRDTRSELWLLALTNMVGERAFYERAAQRDDRYTALVHEAAVADPDWTARMLAWLRGEGNLRTAALVGAVEYVRARLAADEPAHADVSNRGVISSVLQRADEPAEMLAYWTSRYGRAVPKPVKRGIADAVRRLYTERSYLKYDGAQHGYRMADVLELVHPGHDTPAQAELYKHIIDARHGNDTEPPAALATLRARQVLTSTPVDQRRALLGEAQAPVFASAGMTWEALGGWLQGPMDARAWCTVLPSMGYMALLRNLRNLDQAAIPDATAQAVAARLADPGQVARSRQLPMRFLSAYNAAPSLRWAWPLEQALQHSLANIPALGGRTLVLVDTSYSMRDPFSRDGSLHRWDAATLFGLALAARCAAADVVSFSSHSVRFPVLAGESVLRAVARWRDDGYFLGGGTETAAAVAGHYAGHDRVVILTDEQAARGGVGRAVPAAVPLYTWNLAGYAAGHAADGPNRYTFGGLTDAAFRTIPLLEAGRDATWPF